MTNLDIETFWAVVHHGTMTAAAESLFITQPTLSMRIRALEERVGTPLFLRGKGQRRITLTAAGQKFLTLAAAAGGDGVAGGAGAAGVSADRRHVHHQPVHSAAGVQAVFVPAAAGVPVDTHHAGRGHGAVAAAA